MNSKIAVDNNSSGSTITAPRAQLRKIPRRGRSGKLTPLVNIEYGMKLLKLRNKYVNAGYQVPKKLSYQSIANKVGVFSRNTIAKWNHSDMTANAIFLRQNRKARKKKFTTEEESILTGWVVFKELTLESSTSLKFKEFVFSYFNRVISPSFISKFMKRNHLSLKQVGNANYKERHTETFNEGIRFLETLETIVSNYNFQLDQIIVMDKTYLMTSPFHKNVKHMCMKGRNKARKITCSRGAAQEIWTTLRSDGAKSPFFLQTKDKKIFEMKIFDDSDNAHVSLLSRDPELKKQIRPGERGMLYYLHYMINIAKFIKRGDLLLFDGELSFTTPTVQKYLKDAGVYPLTIEPSCLHQLLSPCDNNFHSVFKLNYYRLISHENYQNISIAEKFRLAKQCYESIDAFSISNMFKRCGLIESSLGKSEVLCNLMYEGISFLEKHNEYHRKKLLSYLQWCKNNNIDCSSLTVNMLKFAGLVK